MLKPVTTVSEHKSIRIADLEDIPTIHALIHAIWEPTYGPILAKEQVDYMLQEIYSPESLRKQIKNLGHTFLLLYVKDVAVGFASFSVRPEDSLVYKLHKLYLLPGNQGQGLGNFLIREVSERAQKKGAQWLDLNVNRYNPARQFYEHLGFLILREEDIPVGPYWMNDYVMRKAL